MIAIDNNARMAFVIQTGKGQIEAPNWSRDGKTLIFNRGGKLWSVPAVEGEGSIAEATPIDIGNASDCTGSHGLSPDGIWLAMTCTTPDHPGRRVYILPAAGGAPRMVTANPDSYFHSWSPDGKTILFTRPSHGTLNIFAISADGGAETALTTGAGVSDDPDFSADGQWIYFNSDRAGGMQIWRIRADGSTPEQVTFDEKHNWTPHPSPDGKSILILSYDKDVTGHAANKDVTLRIIRWEDSRPGRDCGRIGQRQRAQLGSRWRALCVCELPVSARRRHRLDAMKDGDGGNADASWSVDRRSYLPITSMGTLIVLGGMHWFWSQAW
jgi:Tol biopolymer transport system component